MLVTFQIATTSGIAVAYFVGAALSGTESWRLILSLSAIPAVIVLVLIVRLPDTARWLLMNGQREEAADPKGRPLEAIRTYWYNGGSWPEENQT